MTEGLTCLEQAPTSLLLGPVGPARRDAEVDLRDLSETIHTASRLLEGLPEFLGAQTPEVLLRSAESR